VAGTELILFQTQGPDAGLAVDHGNSESKIVIGVPSVAVVAEKMSRAGYSANAITSHGPYKILIAYDPDGYKLELVEHPAKGV